MNKRLIIGFLLGMLVTGIAFAVGSNNSKDININKQFKIEVQQTERGIATGRIMLKINGKWYQFQNQVYPLRVK